MSNIQQLRKLAVKLSTTGTTEQISAPFKLYKDSYGFVLIQCFVPATRNTTNAPLCTVYKTSIDLEGKRTKGTGNYNLIYVGQVVLDGFNYSLFESPMPREFTDTEGDLQIVFNYADTDGQGTAISLLTTNIFNTTVTAGGWNNDGVQLEITSQEAAQINANKIAIEELRDEQDDFISKAEDLIGEAETAIKNFADTPNVVDNNFEIENNTTVLKQTSKTPSTNIETTLTKSIPVATAENDGQMSKDDVIAIQNLNQRINVLENIGTIYSVTIPENPTQEELTGLFISAANVEVGTIPPDGTQLKDVTQGITYQFFASSNLWELLSTPQVSQWSNDSLGIVKGSDLDGQIYAENDGTGSVNGWDVVKTDINNNRETIATIDSELNSKFTLPEGGTTEQVLSGAGTLITPSATPTSGGTVPFTDGGAYTELNKKANLQSPTFTGTPKAPTPVATSNDTTIATTSFVKSQNPFKILWDWQKTAGLSAPPTLTANYQLPIILTIDKKYQIELFYSDRVIEFIFNTKAPNTMTSFFGAIGHYFNDSNVYMLHILLSNAGKVTNINRTGGSGSISTTNITSFCTLLRIVEIIY